jgi:hypothetical protein
LRFPEINYDKRPYAFIERSRDYLRAGCGDSPPTRFLIEYIKRLSLHKGLSINVDIDSQFITYLDSLHCKFIENYTTDAGFSQVPKEGWELERSSKMKVLPRNRLDANCYFSKGVSHFVKALW